MTELLKKPPSVKRWFMLIPLILSGIWFSQLEKTILDPEYLLHIRLDDYIPFMPSFVVPYVIWYLYVAVPAFLLFWRSPSEFIKMAAFLSFGMFIACAVYTIFPNGQALRPKLSGHYDDPFVRLIRYIYSKDTPANCAPSIHVIYSISACIAICRYNNSAAKRMVWLNALAVILGSLCAVSTVFVKQHSAFDLFAGVVVSVILYYFIYARSSQTNRREQEA